MSWHYQAMIAKCGGITVREVYNMDGIVGWTGPIEPYGESKAELVRDLEKMLRDVKNYPIIEDRDETKQTD